jgi:predicted site-specific integrase-resolvase
MKLSDYAKRAGVSYQTAWRWWKNGDLQGYQQPSGTIIVEVKDESPAIDEAIACIYARVSSGENRDNLDRPAERLIQYATARGYRIYKVVKEVGSGLNDNRKQLTRILPDKNYNILLVEPRDRLARFGTNYLQILLEELGKKLEIVNNAEKDRDDLMQDFVSIIVSFTARLYGQRRAKRKTEKIIADLQTTGDKNDAKAS